MKVTTVASKCTHDFGIIAGRLTIEQAYNIINSNNRLAVVVDDRDTPISLITRTSLDHVISSAPDESRILTLNQRRDFLPPVITIEADLPLDVVVQHPHLNLLQYGVPGLVVFEQNKIIGILEQEKISQYIKDGYSPNGTIAGYLFAGRIIPKKLEIPCAKCDHLNKLQSIDMGNLPQCQNEQVPKHQFLPKFLLKDK